MDAKREMSHEGTQARPAILEKIGEIVEQLTIALVVVESYGSFSILRVGDASESSSRGFGNMEKKNKWAGGPSIGHQIDLSDGILQGTPGALKYY
jgi:hypothetical protein